ncbi:hypothetical protein PNOK_0962400 [Pyrrhoderma noxium]|uniref:Uncharacterized protein n=1 Tax=Pyrrhoderma noxium TaxID=2282107 RepID=A0A286U653_9AGAM|nr:hypothetical protein PNOK_0962400 [Pyrrhoderma noxium]
MDNTIEVVVFKGRNQLVAVSQDPSAKAWPEDCDLSIDQIWQAAPRFLRAIKVAKWGLTLVPILPSLLNLAQFLPPFKTVAWITALMKTAPKINFNAPKLTSSALFALDRIRMITRPAMKLSSEAPTSLLSLNESRQATNSVLETTIISVSGSNLSIALKPTIFCTSAQDVVLAPMVPLHALKLRMLNTQHPYALEHWHALLQRHLSL